jgi:hypothetical protein
MLPGMLLHDYNTAAAISQQDFWLLDVAVAGGLLLTVPVCIKYKVSGSGVLQRAAVEVCCTGHRPVLYCWCPVTCQAGRLALKAGGGAGMMDRVRCSPVGTWRDVGERITLYDSRL